MDVLLLGTEFKLNSGVAKKFVGLNEIDPTLNVILNDLSSLPTYVSSTIGNPSTDSWLSKTGVTTLGTNMAT